MLMHPVATSGMFLDCARKSDYSEETQSEWWECALNTEKTWAASNRNNKKYFWALSVISFKLYMQWIVRGNRSSCRKPTCTWEHTNSTKKEPTLPHLEIKPKASLDLHFQYLADALIQSNLHRTFWATKLQLGGSGIWTSDLLISSPVS